MPVTQRSEDVYLKPCIIIKKKIPHTLEEQEIEQQLQEKFSPISSSAELPEDIITEDTDETEQQRQITSFDILSFNNPKYTNPNYYNSYLRPLSRFLGVQQSGSSKYNIKVEFKNVDLANSLVVGFLQISGLAEKYPEIVTCFKGEIINNPLKVQSKKEVLKSYTFLTENAKWGSSFSNDLDHWKKLTNSYAMTDDKFLKKLKMIYHNEMDQGLVYMRWKEEFLLPDAKVKQIDGASFEGFYYIVLNIGNRKLPNFPIGSINGLYYHNRSEKFQSLNLTSMDSHVVNEVYQFL